MQSKRKMLDGRVEGWIQGIERQNVRQAFKRSFSTERRRIGAWLGRLCDCSAEHLEYSQ